MSESIDWDLLQNQYTSNNLYCNNLSKLCKIVDNPFACSLSRMPGLLLQKIKKKHNIISNPLIFQI